MPLAVLGAVTNARYTERALFPCALSERTWLRLVFPLQRESYLYTLPPRLAHVLYHIPCHGLAAAPLLSSRASTLSPAHAPVRIITLRRPCSHSNRARALSSRVPFSSLYALSRPFPRVRSSLGDRARSLSLLSRFVRTLARANLVCVCECVVSVAVYMTCAMVTRSCTSCLFSSYGYQEIRKGRKTR